MRTLPTLAISAAGLCLAAAALVGCASSAQHRTLVHSANPNKGKAGSELFTPATALSTAKFPTVETLAPAFNSQMNEWNNAAGNKLNATKASQTLDSLDSFAKPLLKASNADYESTLIGPKPWTTGLQAEVTHILAEHKTALDLDFLTTPGVQGVDKDTRKAYQEVTVLDNVTPLPSPKTGEISAVETFHWTDNANKNDALSLTNDVKVDTSEKKVTLTWDDVNGNWELVDANGALL